MTSRAATMISCAESSPRGPLGHSAAIATACRDQAVRLSRPGAGPPSGGGGEPWPADKAASRPVRGDARAANRLRVCHPMKAAAAGRKNRGLCASVPSPSFNGIHVGPFDVRVYGLMYVLGVIAAVAMTSRRWERQDGSRELVT